MAFTVSAQEAATGTIEGRVMNARNGTFLSRARVTVEGTNLITFTNDFGEYQLRNVPAGTVQVTVNYTGQDPQTTTVTVPANASATQNFSLGEAARGADGTIQLDQFVVASERYKTASEIAINEERYSVNFKNVVAADAFGDIQSGNVGEFIKFLPGVELEYGGTYIAPTDAYGVSIRGFGPADTAIYIDGVPVASAPQAQLTNQVGLDMLSINNASRVELIKVPTPDMPMNSIGGQINLISRSAFEYARPSFTWDAYVTINSEYPNPFEKIAGPGEDKVYAGQPGFRITYVRPVNEKFGISVSAGLYQQFNVNRKITQTYEMANVNIDRRPFGGANNTPASNAIGPVSPSNPFLGRVAFDDTPRTSSSYNGSIKADWRPFPGLTLSGTYAGSKYDSTESRRRVQFRIQRPDTWDATHTASVPYLLASQSATGSAFNPGNTVEMDVESRDKVGHSHTGSLRAEYKRGGWDIYALASGSTSRSSFIDFDNEHFSASNLQAQNVGTMRFENIVDGVPGTIVVLDREGQPYDYSDLSRWQPTIQGRSGKAESMKDNFTYRLDVARDLDFLPWREKVQLTAKTGWLREVEKEKKWGRGTNYRESYIGPALSESDYLDTTYLGYSPGFGLPAQEWISNYRLYDIYQANPNNFTVTDADDRENWYSYVGQNKRFKETRDEIYAMLSARALSNRLNIIAGARQAFTERDAAGPRGDADWNYVKEANGQLYRNVALVGGNGLVRIDQANSLLFANTAAGQALRTDLTNRGIEFPTAVIANNSAAFARLSRRALVPTYGKTENDPSPSISVAYNITENLVGRVSWTKTFGMPSIEDASRGLLSGNQNDFRIDQAEDPAALPRGTIRVANPNLLPDISTNWDYSLSYYTNNGGKFEVSYYTKSIENFSEEITTLSGTPEFNQVLTSLGLDPSMYEDWVLTTSVNGVGAGKVSGYELQAQQNLSIIPALGQWGKRINMFATYSKSKRSETNTTRISDRPAGSELATAGVNVSLRRLSLSVKGTWRTLTRIRGDGNILLDGVTYAIGQYDPSNTKVDVNINYQLTPRYSIYLSGRDVFQRGQRRDRFDLAGIIPPYAHWREQSEFGTQVTIGVRGTY